MRTFAAPLLILLALAGCAGGTETTATDADRTIVVQMRDNRFDPSKVDVDHGETIAFRFINRGSARHDAFIGDEDAQEAHEREMRTAKDDDEHGDHTGADDDAVTVDPRKTETLEYRFTKKGTTLIGCHEPGHYAQGMVVRVTVS
jgi:uncharacterized cupredoxin-like copper-binding protein